MNKLDQLYAEYGKLMVQAEIIQNTISNIKQQIAQELQKNASTAQNTETTPEEPRKEG